LTSGQQSPKKPAGRRRSLKFEHIVHRPEIVKILEKIGLVIVYDIPYLFGGFFIMLIIIILPMGHNFLDNRFPDIMKRKIILPFAFPIIENRKEVPKLRVLNMNENFPNSAVIEKFHFGKNKTGNVMPGAVKVDAENLYLPYSQILKLIYHTPILQEIVFPCKSAILQGARAKFLKRLKKIEKT
jgi:hypothetical protein